MSKIDKLYTLLEFYDQIEGRIIKGANSGTKVIIERSNNTRIVHINATGKFFGSYDLSYNPENKEYNKYIKEVY